MALSKVSDLNIDEVANIFDPSNLSDHLVNSLLRDYDKTFDGKKHTVKEVLTHEEQQTLTKSFPEYDLTFLSRVKHPHAYAAASRKLEYKVLVDRFGFSKDTRVPVGYDDLLCDIGGEFSFHLINGHEHIHSCNPILDIRDAARSVTRNEQILRMTLSDSMRNYLQEKKYTNYVNFLSDANCRETISCNNRAQDCSRTARYGICLHSSYDITLNDFADIMIKKNMYEIYGSFIFSDIVMLENHGIIPGVEAFFSIDKSKNTIQFSFVGDSSLCYVHDLDSYFALITLNHFVHKDTNTTFLIELLENRSGIQFFKIIRLDGTFVGSKLTKYIWLNSLKGKTKVNFFDIDDQALAKGDFKNGFIPVSFYVDNELIDKIVSHAYASTESKFRPIEIFNFLTAYNGRIFFGSDVCIRNKPLPAYQSMLLANAIYLYVYSKKYNLGKIDQMLIAAIRHDRELSDKCIIGKALSKKFTPPRVFDTDHAKFKCLRAISQPIHAFLYWFKKSPFESIKFLEGNCSFINCTDTISTYEYQGSVKSTGAEFSHTMQVAGVLDQSRVFQLKEYISSLFNKFSSDDVVFPLGDFIAAPPIVPVINRDIDYGYLSKFLANSSVISEIVSSLPLHSFDQQSVEKFTGNTLVLGEIPELDIVGSYYALTDKVFDHYSSDKLTKVLQIVKNFPIKNILVNGNSGFSISDIVAIFNSLDNHFLYLAALFTSLTEEYLYLLYHVDCVFANSLRLSRLPTKFDPLLKLSHELSYKFEEFYEHASYDGQSLIELAALIMRFSTEVAERSKKFLETRKADEFNESGLLDIEDCDTIETMRSRLAGYTEEQIREARARVNPFEHLGKSKYVSRSAIKLLEIDSLHHLTNVSVAVDLCGAPGGFVQVLLEKGVSEVFTISQCDNINYNSALYDDLRVDIYDHHTCDLLDENVSSNFVKYVLGKVGRVPLVLADGSLNCNGKEHLEEELNLPLLIAQFRVAQNLLDSGGNFLLKVFGVSSISRSFMINLYSNFEKIIVLKPKTSRPASSEKYLICLGYGGCSNYNDDVFDGINSVQKFALADLLAALVDQDRAVAEDHTLDYLLNDARANVSEERLEFVENVSPSIDVRELSTVDAPEMTFGDFSVGEVDSFCDDISVSTFNTVSEGICDTLDNSDNDSIGSVETLVPESLNPRVTNYLDGAVEVRNIPSEHLNLLDKFVRNLDVSGGSIAKSLNYGDRREWLYSHCDYSYGKRRIQPSGDFASVSYLYKDIFNIPVNTLLLVYYPPGSRGIPPHRDDEKIHSNDSVVTFCLGDSAFLNLHSRKLQSIELNNGDAYCFRNQKHFRHSISDIKASEGRWAFTFRLFKGKTLQNSGNFKDFGGNGNCLFHCLTGNNRVEIANQLRLYLYENSPPSLGDPSYLYSELREECASPGIYAGISTISAFCFLFQANVTVLQYDSVRNKYKEIFVKKDYNNPLYNIVLEYSSHNNKGGHYRRWIPCVVDDLVRNSFPFVDFDLAKTLSIIQKSFCKERSFIDALLFRDNTLFKDGFFYNSLANLCFERNCGCLHGVVNFVENASADCLLLLHSKMAGFDRVLKFLDERKFFFRILCIPGASSLGFFFILVSPGVPYSRYCFEKEFTLLEKHSSTCANCLSGNVVSPPLYNHSNHTYYFCSRRDAVVTVSDLEGADRVFRLVDYIDSYDLVDRGECVDIPVPSRGGFVTTNRRELLLLQKAVDKFIDRVGGVVVAGLLVGSFRNPKRVIDMLAYRVSRVCVKHNNSGFLSGGINFNPEFAVDFDDNTYILNSMIEAREYQKCIKTSIIGQIKALHSQYLNIVTSPSFMAGNNTFNNQPDFALIDMSNACYIVPPKGSGGPYMCAFDGEDLVDISSAHTSKYFSRDFGKDCSWLKPGVFRGFMSVTKDTKVVNSEKIYNYLKNFDLSNFSRNFEIELIEGVPGCGKTHYIINNHKFSMHDTDEIVLTASREAANDLRKRVAVIYKVDPDHPMLKKKYRTIDSFLMHYASGKYAVKTIWLDEGLMKHFGDSLWCAYISDCTKLKMLGDRAQVPFVNRIPGIKLRNHLPSLSSKTMPVTFLSVTHRCPVDVAAMLNRFEVYPNRVTSSSTVRRSLHTQVIKNVGDILGACSGYKILTFTHGEKDSISKSVNSKVSTIAEYQGNQSDSVLLIRTNTKELDIFSNMNQILVGISRHRKNFLYATVVADRLFDLLSSSIPESEIDSCSRIKGGGVILGKTVGGQLPLFNVIPRAAAMVDMLKQDRIIRDFVMDNDGSAFAPLRVTFSEVSLPPVDIPVAPPFYVSDCVTNIQYGYDMLFPGQSLPDFSYDNQIFAQDDLFFSVKENFVLNRLERSKFPCFDCLMPTIRTSCPSPVITNAKTVLKAFYDRNGNVPMLQGIADDESLADLMYSNFLKAYVADNVLFSSFRDNPVEVNVDSIEDWLFTQPPGVKKKAFPDGFNNIMMQELNKYSMILKKLPKPKLEPGAEYKFPSPQTIAHTAKDINAVFCPIIRELKKRLLSVLRSNVLLYSDVSVDDFEDILTCRLPAGLLREYKHIIENDFSKYDKSQNRTTLLFEIKMLIALGFPLRLVPTWIFMHVYTTVASRFAGFKARIFFQRKSGDAMTFFGNTIFLMAVFVSCGVDEIIELIISGDIIALFSGDDLLAFSRKKIDTTSMPSEFAIRFNLESKLLNFNTAYFCSKFLIMTPWGKWVMVPDVAKLITKLGRRDLVNYLHVEEYRISCLDVAKHLGNSLLYPLIDQVLMDRYKLKYNTFGFLYSALFTAYSNADVFRSLYYIKDCSVIDFRRAFSRLNDF